MNEPKLRFKADDGGKFPDWEGKSFEQTFSNLNNSTFSRDCLNYENGNVKYIHYGDILVKFGETVDVNNYIVPYVNDGLNCEKYNTLENGDVVIADTAEDETVGKVVEISETDSQKTISGLHTIACRPKEKFAPKYLGYFMNSDTYHNQLRPYMQGIKVTSISKANIKLTSISIPSLPEQQKIAEFLSTIDTVIAKQKETVSAWKERKKGVMQKLFSQEVRFKADDGSDFPEWEEKSFSDVFENLNNSTFSRDCLNYEAGNVKYIHYGDILTKFDFAIDVQSSNVPYVNEDLDCEKYASLSDGDIVIADTAEDDTVGRAVEIMNTHCGKTISGLHTIACHPREKFASKYLGYFMNADIYHNQLRPYMQGIKVTSVNKTNIVLTKILVPCLAEQQKIADCLSSLDDVIKKQKATLAAWEEMKKGLLQQMFV